MNMRVLKFCLMLPAAAMLFPLCATSASAAHTPNLISVKKPLSVILLKNKTDREAAEARKQNCRPALQPMTEGRAQRDCACPKPRPILM